MSNPDTNIRAAFTAKLLTLSPMPSIAWENVEYTPTPGIPYLMPFLLPGEPVQAELGQAGQNRHVGIYQVSVYSPSGKGVGDISTLRDKVIDLFKRGTVLTYSATSLTIQKSFGGPTMQETDWIHLPVTIRYMLLAPN
jgi:hypothetical protein